VKVITELPGGLGNQLFAFTAGLAVSTTFNAKLVVNAQRMDRRHDPGLFFEIIEKELISSVIRSRFPIYDELQSHSSDFIKARILSRWLKSYFHLVSDNLLFEEAQGLSVLLKKGEFFAGKARPRAVYVTGTHKDFRNIELTKERLGYEFCHQVIFRKSFLDLLEESRNSLLRKTLTVHIRHGDFSGLGMRGPGALDISYYSEAICELRKRIGTRRLDARVIGDSNSMKEEVTLLLKSNNFNVPEVDHKAIRNAKSDFVLALASEYLIVSNSTFSLWSAYLNPFSACVLRPDPIYRPSSEDSILGIPDSWARISSQFID